MNFLYAKLSRLSLLLPLTVPDPAIVQNIRIAGFIVMGLGIVVLVRKWWRNR